MLGLALYLSVGGVSLPDSAVVPAPQGSTRPALLGHLAASCRQVREEQDVPRARLAELVGVDRTAIFRFEQARSWPKHPGRVVDGYARVCAVSPQLIWGRAIKALADSHPPAGARHARLRAAATQLLEHGGRVEASQTDMARALRSGREAALDRFFDADSPPFALFDARARIVRVNAALAALTGYPIAAHRGQRITDLVPWVVVDRQVRRVLHKGETLRLRLTPTSSSPPCRFLACYFPVREHCGEHPLAVAMIAAEIAELSTSAAVPLVAA